MMRNAPRYIEPENSLYNLPFGVGESYELRQGNCTFHTHSVEYKNEFAFDFVMDIGTPIHAARAGKFASIEERFFDGNNEESDFNYIAIAHEDGSFAFYIHITNSGATVELGEFVQQGDVIAYSGDTGIESIPHLHFHVIELDDSCAVNNVIGACSTIPVSFKNASPNDKVLVQGVTYTAI